MTLSLALARVAGSVAAKAVAKNLAKAAGVALARNAATSLIDNCFRGKVQPRIGSLVYVDMFLGAAEHSGIYVGGDEVVELGGDGYVRKVSARHFLDDGSLKMTAISIYVSSHGGRGVGSKEVAQRALSLVGSRRHYNVFTDNCHRFCIGCLAGDDGVPCISLPHLKDIAKTHLGADEWRVWDR